MTEILRVQFKSESAMGTDARWMHNRIMKAASHAQTHTLFRAHDLPGTLFTIVTDDPAFNPARWGSTTERLERQPYQPEVAVSQRRHFSVRLSPVTRRAGRTARALRTPEELDGFVERLSLQNGFEVLNYAARWERGYIMNQQAPPLPSVLVEGELEVLDSAAFSQALLKGIGRSKRFGFGLLLSGFKAIHLADSVCCSGCRDKPNGA